jgi:ribosomal protein S18 acetylase RimI-like enzyme
MSPDLLDRIRTSLIRATSPSRECRQVGPFIAMLSPNDDIPWINYAVPNESTAGDLHPHLDALEQFFRDNQRKPRFEFFHELAPELQRCLIDRGYNLQAELPAMVCTLQTFHPQTHIDTALIGPDGNLRTLAEVTMKSFGATDPPKPEEIEVTRAGMLAGRTRGAMATVNGAPAGGAYTVGDDDVCELAGVGTLPEFRRLGVASAVSSALMAEQFRNPEAVVWLSAGDEVAKAVYEKLGFQTVATQLNYIHDSAA